MLVEVGREVQQRVFKSPPPRQQQRDQDASDAPVAVAEGVDRLESVVRPCHLDERGRPAFVRDVLEQVGEAVAHPRGRRRRVDRDAACGDVVLHVPEPPRPGASLAARARHQRAVDVADEVGIDRRAVAHALQAVLERGDVVERLASVVVRGGRAAERLDGGEFEQRGARALDLRAADGFLAQVQGRQRIRLAHHAAEPGEQSEVVLGLGEQVGVLGDGGALNIGRRREGVRHECVVPPAARRMQRDDLARRVGEVGDVHRVPPPLVKHHAMFLNNSRRTEAR